MHLSMKLFDMFDQTPPPHTLDKIMAKTCFNVVSNKNDLKA